MTRASNAAATTAPIHVSMNVEYNRPHDSIVFLLCFGWPYTVALGFESEFVNVSVTVLHAFLLKFIQSQLPFICILFLFLLLRAATVALAHSVYLRWRCSSTVQSSLHRDLDRLVGATQKLFFVTAYS